MIILWKLFQYNNNNCITYFYFLFMECIVPEGCTITCETKIHEDQVATKRYIVIIISFASRKIPLSFSN